MPANAHSLESRKILDSSGELKTLLRGVTSFIQCTSSNFEQLFSPKSTATQKSNKKNIIFLGLSYNAKEYAQSLCNDTEQNVYYIECLNFIQALDAQNIQNTIPENFIELSADSLFNLLNTINLESVDFYFYKQNIQLFPSFWYNILYTIQDIIKIKQENNATQKADIVQKSIFLALFNTDLMHKELSYAIENIKYNCISPPIHANTNLALNEEDIHILTSFIGTKNISLFLSINGRCLDAYGRIFYLLQHLKIPVALWIVDNVWNILSKFKSDFWKECPLFVTDKSFISMLEKHGAKYVYYMPLAGHSMPYVKDTAIKQDIELLYLGHSQFKNKDSFFAAVHKDENILVKYKKEIDNYYNNISTLPDFNYVYENLYPNAEKKLWPRNDFREISYIATQLDNYNKKINISLLKNLTIIGDDGWKEILGADVNILPPVDYYTSLHTFYARARYTLNIPSLLMPHALTQRHFDVWLAKGFLLTLYTSGLEIFNKDLARAITIKNTDKIQDIIENYSADKKLYTEIQENMCEEIRTKHLYIHRLEEICKILGL